MSVSYTYFTRRFLFQNYRDAVAVAIISSFFVHKALRHFSVQSDNHFILVRLIYRIKLNSKDYIQMMRLIFTTRREPIRLMELSKEKECLSLQLKSRLLELRKKESMNLYFIIIFVI